MKTEMNRLGMILTWLSVLVLCVLFWIATFYAAAALCGLPLTKLFSTLPMHTQPSTQKPYVTKN